MWLSVLCMMFTALGAVGYNVRVLVADDQPLQPFDKYGGPCPDVAKLKNDEPACRGGFPAIAAIMSNLSSGVRHTLKVGFLEQVSQLILTHPTYLDVNDRLWLHAGVEMLYLPRSYITSSRRTTDIERYFFQNADTPTVVANLREGSFPVFRGAFKHYYIKEFDTGLRIAFIATFPTQYFVETIKVSQIKALVNRLRSVDKVDLVIVRISPKTFNDDIASAEAGEGGADLYMYTSQRSASEGAVNVTRWPGGHWTMNTLRVSQSIETLNIEVDPATRKIASASLDITPVHPLPAEMMDATFRNNQQLVQEVIDQGLQNDKTIGVSANPMPHGHLKFPNGSRYDSCRHQECELGVLHTDAIYKQLSVDAVFINGGGMRDGWDAGEVKRGHFSRAYPFTNQLCYLNITGAGLLRALRHSVDAIGTDGEYNSSESVTGHFLQVAGMRYSFNPKLPKENRITSVSVRMDGVFRSLDLKRAYRVVTVNFLCTGGDDYALVGHKNSMETSQEDVWPYLTEYFKYNSPYTAMLHGNIRTDDGEPLDLIKTAEECGKYARYLPEWEACEPCVEGYYHPVPGEEPCILEPASSPTSDKTAVIVIPIIAVFFVVALVALGAYHYSARVKEKNALRNAPGSGVVSFVFTDIQSSTSLWGEYPEAMAKALDEHHRVIRRNIEYHRGYEVKTIGDAFMVVFADCRDAVIFCMAIQEDLLSVEWPAELMQAPSCLRVECDGTVIFSGLRVRAGVHVGPATAKRTPQGGVDYEGSTVNIAARVGNSGAGGQTVITEEVYDLVQESLNDLDIDMEVTFLGSYKFKGVSDPVTCLHVLPSSCEGRASHFKGLRDCERVTEEVKAETTEGSNLEIKDFASQSSEGGVYSKEGKLAALETLRKAFRNGMHIEQVARLVATIVDSREVGVPRLSLTFLQAMMDIEGGPRRPPQQQVSRVSRSASRVSHGSRSGNGAMPAGKIIFWPTFLTFVRRLPNQGVILLASVLDSEECIVSPRGLSEGQPSWASPV